MRGLLLTCAFLFVVAGFIIGFVAAYEILPSRVEKVYVAPATVQAPGPDYFEQPADFQALEIPA